MTSEHDTVFEEVKRFVNLALGFAREAVLKEGEFLPYGYALTREDQIECVAGLPNLKATDHDSEEVMEFIYSGLERGILENRYKAVATILCANAFVRSPAEGNPLEESRIIQVKWEHESGLAKEALIPYHWDGPGKAAIGQIVVKEGESRFFHV